MRDPAVGLGFCFICLLLIQWLNGGRELVFNAATHRWVYTPPPIPWLPSSFNRAEAFEIIAWFVPAWSMVAVARGARIERRHAVTILYIVVANAACLGLLGIAQFVTHTKAIFWRFHIEAVFFATFGYSNHAGIYFLVAAMLALALLVYEVDHHRSTSPGAGRIGLLASALVICVISVHLSYSRGAILLLWCSAAVTIAAVMWRLWPRLWPAQRINSIAMAIAVASLGAGAAVVFGGYDLKVEVGSLARLQSWAWLTADSDRRVMAQAAVDIWRESPVWGVGGWGFRYCLGQHLAPEQWHLITAGKANVHNDALQYLCEFGLVGMGLLLAVLALLLRPWRIALRSGSAAGVPIIAGSVVLLIFSLIDLPFRSPAIITLWLTMLLAGLPLMSQASKDETAFIPGTIPG